MLRIAGSLFLLTSLLSAEVDWRFAHPGADILLGLNLKSISTSPAGASLKEMVSGMGGGKISLDRLKMFESVDEIYVSVRTRYVKGRPAGEPLGVILVLGNFDSGTMMRMFEKQPKVAARFIDRHTILLGDEESMAAAVERLKGDDGLATPVVTRAKELAAQNDFWIVGSPAPLNSMKPRGSLKSQGGVVSDIEAIFDNLRSFSLGVALRDDLKLDLGVNFRTKAAAHQLMALYHRLQSEMQKTPEGQKQLAEMAQSLEVHPNGTAVRFSLHADMANVQQAMAQAAQGIMAPIPVQVAEQRPVSEVMPERPAPVVARPVVPGRRTVRVYGMDTGYREIPATPR